MERKAATGNERDREPQSDPPHNHQPPQRSEEEGADGRKQTTPTVYIDVRNPSPKTSTGKRMAGRAVEPKEAAWSTLECAKLVRTCTYRK